MVRAWCTVIVVVLLWGCGDEDLYPLLSPHGDYLRQGTLTPPARVFLQNPRALLHAGEIHGYHLALEAGERVTLELSGACPSLFSALYLFDRDDHDADRPPLASGTGALSCGATARIEGFEAPTSDDYLVIVTAELGSGAYQLDVSCEHCTSESPWTASGIQTAAHTTMADDDLSGIGEAIFQHVHQLPEGLGHGDPAEGVPPPGFRLVHEGPFGGPDAQSCVSCHNVGGDHGGGGLGANIYQGSDGVDTKRAFHRNAPSIRGLGIRQAIAAELSAALTAQLDKLRAMPPQEDELCVLSESVCFGTASVDAGGAVDASKLQSAVGYDVDTGKIVVQPFGWKGREATIQGFVGGGLRVHFGLQLESKIKPICDAYPYPFETEILNDFKRTWGEYDACPDPDEDGKTAEVTDGQLAALAVYLMQIAPPKPAPAVHPGRDVFRQIGCANCHTPRFPLASSVDTSLGVEVTLPAYPQDLEIWSDFRRHSLGRALWDDKEFKNTETGEMIPPQTFVTPPLWDVASTAPYMHDGRAETLTEAIVAHGRDEGDAAADSVQAFESLDEEREDDKRALLDFLCELGKDVYASKPCRR